MQVNRAVIMGNSKSRMVEVRSNRILKQLRYTVIDLCDFFPYPTRASGVTVTLNS